MHELSKNLWLKIHDAAKRAAALYARDILSVETLSQLIAQNWIALHTKEHGESPQEEQNGQQKEVQPPFKVIWRIAQRICSYELHNAWCSKDDHLHVRAYTSLAHYFTHLLKLNYSDYLRLYDEAIEDAVNQTLEELYELRNGEKKMDDPAAFIRWTQVILHRKALAIVNKRKREEHTDSLEQRLEDAHEEFVDPRNRDPMMLVVEDELREELVKMLAMMRNKNYVRVLTLQFLEDRDDTEIAQIMGIKIETVWLWRHRALRWLRRKYPNIEKLLRFLSD